MTADARICGCCQQPTSGNLLLLNPADKSSPLIAENHDRCNRARLMASLSRAAAATDARLRSRTAP